MKRTTTAFLSLKSASEMRAWSRESVRLKAVIRFSPSAGVLAARSMNVAERKVNRLGRISSVASRLAMRNTSVDGCKTMDAFEGTQRPSQYRDWTDEIATLGPNTSHSRLQVWLTIPYRLPK